MCMLQAQKASRTELWILVGADALQLYKSESGLQAACSLQAAAQLASALSQH